MTHKITDYARDKHFSAIATGEVPGKIILSVPGKLEVILLLLSFYPVTIAPSGELFA